MTVSEIVYYAILILGILIGIIRFKALSIPAKTLWALFIYIFLKEVSASLLAYQVGYNLSFYQLMSPLDFCLTAFIFASIGIMQSFRKHILIASIIVFVFFFLNLFVWQPPGSGADTNFKMFRSFFLIIFSLALFTRLSDNADMGNIFKKSSFWVGAGVMIFYTFNIFYWGAYNYFLGHNKGIMNSLLRPMFIGVNYILYVFLAIALFLNRFGSPEKKLSR
jgi:hypothetical protein